MNFVLVLEYQPLNHNTESSIYSDMIGWFGNMSMKTAAVKLNVSSNGYMILNLLLQTRNGLTFNIAVICRFSFFSFQWGSNHMVPVHILQLQNKYLDQMSMTGSCKPLVYNYIVMYVSVSVKILHYECFLSIVDQVLCKIMSLQLSFCKNRGV